jgi:hypothetical protein
MIKPIVSTRKQTNFHTALADFLTVTQVSQGILILKIKRYSSTDRIQQLLLLLYKKYNHCTETQKMVAISQI